MSITLRHSLSDEKSSKCEKLSVKITSSYEYRFAPIPWAKLKMQGDPGIASLYNVFENTTSKVLFGKPHKLILEQYRVPKMLNF